MSFNWKGLIGTVAPTLATALGGPMAGAAVKAIAGAVGLDDGATEKDIEVALRDVSPDVLMRIKEADNTFDVKMKELGVDILKLDQQDRASARDMAAKTGREPQIVLSVVYTLGYIWLLYAFVTGGVQVAEGVKSEFSIVLGVLTAAQSQILNFWFGSSSGSKEKTAHLAAGRH